MMLLVVGSVPGNGDPGGLADEAAPAVASDQVHRTERTAIADADVDSRVILGEARHLGAAIDGHPEVLDPRGEDPLDVLLPQSEEVRVAGRKAAEIELTPRRTRWPVPSALRRGTGRRCPADRGPPGCARGAPRHASRRCPDPGAARRSRRRRPPAPVPRPASAPSGRPRRSPRRARSSPRRGRDPRLQHPAVPVLELDQRLASTATGRARRRRSSLRSSSGRRRATVAERPRPFAQWISTVRPSPSWSSIQATASVRTASSGTVTSGTRNRRCVMPWAS